jgi:hypothetical protein
VEPQPFFVDIVKANWGKALSDATIHEETIDIPRRNNSKKQFIRSPRDDY